MRMQLAQARQREAALLQQNELLTRKLVDLGSLPENNSLLRQFKIVGCHIEALAQDAAAFNAYLASLHYQDSNHS